MTRRIIGTLLILLGALGIALSALGVIYLWQAAEDVTVATEESLTLVSDALKDIERSLDVASTTLDGGVVAIGGLYTTTLDVSQTLSSTRVTLDEVAELTEDDLPDSIEASLTALEALEETAAVIDQLLRSLQQFGIGGYDPVVSLDEAVAEAGASLAPVPESLRVMGAGLHQTSVSLDAVQSGIILMGDHMVRVRQDVLDAEAALSSHHDNLQQLQTRIRSARRNVDGLIRTVAWGATLLLIWIGLSQLAIVRWGIGLWQRE